MCPAQPPYPLDHAMYQFGGCHIALLTIHSVRKEREQKVNNLEELQLGGSVNAFFPLTSTSLFF